MKRIILILLTAMLSTAPLLAQYSPCYEAAFKEGQRLYNAGQYAQANKYFNEAKGCPDPNEAEVNDMIGKCDKRLAEAERKIQEAARVAAEQEEARLATEAKNREDTAYQKCVTIAACESYLNNYSQGRYVTEVKKKKSELEAIEAGRCYDNHNYAKALELSLNAAEQNDPSAQVLLGEMYHYGHGVAQDYQEAVKWYRKAAEQGDDYGLNNLGFMYENGYGVTQNYQEALKLYRESVEKGNALGQCHLGYMYENGYGVTKNRNEAYKWFRLAADQGNANAQEWVGYYYENGYGPVGQDYWQAIEWYKKAVVQNESSKFVNDHLGWCYFSLKNYDDAISWFKKAADLGDDDAMNEIGVCYCSVADYTSAKDLLYLEAIGWFRKAANQGNANGCYNLADFYFNGVWPATEDKYEAFRWYLKAAEKDHEMAIEKVVECYKNGDGVKKDLKMAQEWQEKLDKIKQQ